MEHVLPLFRYSRNSNVIRMFLTKQDCAASHGSIALAPSQSQPEVFHRIVREMQAELDGQRRLGVDLRQARQLPPPETTQGCVFDQGFRACPVRSIGDFYRLRCLGKKLHPRHRLYPALTPEWEMFLLELNL